MTSWLKERQIWKHNIHYYFRSYDCSVNFMFRLQSLLLVLLVIKPNFCHSSEWVFQRSGMHEDLNTNKHSSLLNIVTVSPFRRPVNIIARVETLPNQQYKTARSKRPWHWTIWCKFLFPLIFMNVINWLY